ncbi:MAG: cytochrome-c peroxidase [Vulcanimicrobiota bacterium]
MTVFKPLPAEMSKEPLDKGMIDLGRMLYYETRLSKDGTISCNSCHDLKSYGVDGEPTSPGVGAQRGGRNSPTVYNAATHISQFWDGRSPDVEDQAKGPITNPVEMAMSDGTEVEARIREIPEYREHFAKVFPTEKEPVTLDNAAKAIGAFERGLVTPDRFDDYLKGDLTALEQKELVGLKTFIDFGCASCHNGVALGGGQYQKLGLMRPYPSEDLGRFEVTGEERDKQKFKVPSLRNIHETGPYLHDGSLSSLDETIRIMAEHQLNKEISDQEVQQISDFLSALTGEIPHDYIKEPASVSSSGAQ